MPINKQHLITGNVLYFEGAGMDFYSNEQTDHSNVGNFRIRTAFKNNEGVEYYIELGNTIRYDFTKKKPKVISNFALGIDHLFKLEDRNKEELKMGGYEIKKDHNAIKQLDYTKKDIVKWINENLNCSFDTMQVLDFMYGYRVHGNNDNYNLMDNIELNHERAAKRKEEYNKVDQEYRTELNEKYSVIGLLEMNDNSITVRCYSSDEKLKNKGIERVKTISINY